jgi:hypothetical protein
MVDKASVDDAVSLHQRGRLQEAAQLYRRILQSDPRVETDAASIGTDGKN